MVREKAIVARSPLRNHELFGKNVTRDAPRIVFMGSPEFALPSLRAVASEYQVVLVVTQPDRPQGRGRTLTAPPVKSLAYELGLPVFQPARLRGRGAREKLAEAAADLFVVVAYGQILSPKMLQIPRMGAINVHGSLLPRYRGAAPIQWAVLHGEQTSGITIMRIEEGLDTGPILLKDEVSIAMDETAGSLHDKLAALGAQLLVHAIRGLGRGEILAVPQRDEEATYAPMLSKDHGRVDFSKSAREVDCWIRGMDPWPGAFASVAGEQLRLFNSRAVSGIGRPGELISKDQRGLLVACGSGAVWIGQVQRPGKRRMVAAAYLAGNDLPLGTILAS
jgi:methionyl-tRNA formyltransferase